MPIMDSYTDLVAELGNEYSRTDLGDRVARAVQVAEARFNRELLVQDREVLAELALVAGENEVSLPADCRQLVEVSMAEPCQFAAAFG